MFDRDLFLERNFMLNDSKRYYIVKEIVFPIVEKYGTKITPEVIGNRKSDEISTHIQHEDDDLILDILSDENSFSLFCGNKKRGTEIMSKVENDFFYIAITKKDYRTLIFNSINNNDNIVNCRIFDVISTKEAQIVRKKGETIFETLIDYKNAILSDDEIVTSPEEIEVVTSNYLKRQKVKVYKKLKE